MKTKDIYKILFKEVCSEDKLDNDKLLSVYHSEGSLIATNGKILARIKYSYKEEFEGKLFIENGTEINDKYMNIEHLLNMEGMIQEDICDLLEAAKKVVKIKDKKYIQLFAGENVDNNFIANAKYIITAYKLLDNPILYRQPDNKLYCIFKSGNDIVLICKTRTDDPDDFYTIEEALNLEVKKEAKTSWYE